MNKYVLTLLLSLNACTIASQDITTEALAACSHFIKTSSEVVIDIACKLGNTCIDQASVGYGIAKEYIENDAVHDMRKLSYLSIQYGNKAFNILSPYAQKIMQVSNETAITLGSLSMDYGNKALDELSPYVQSALLQSQDAIKKTALFVILEAKDTVACITDSDRCFFAAMCGCCVVGSSSRALLDKFHVKNRLVRFTTMAISAATGVYLANRFIRAISF